MASPFFPCSVPRYLAMDSVSKTKNEAIRAALETTCATGGAANQGASVSRNDKVSHKIVSLFEPHTEIIRKGKASKPNEFGKLVQVQEAENQIITHYEVFAERPEDSQLLVP